MSVRPAVNHFKHATPQEKDAVEIAAAHALSWEDTIGRDFHERCNNFYKLYRGFKKFKYAWEAAGPNDRDGVLLDSKTTWGANLHIPLSFATIERTVPRAIAHRPRMLYLPRQERWADNVSNVRLLIDWQQEQIDIDLPFQAVMRSGRIYGLGVGKALWRKEYATRRRVQRRMFKRDEFRVGDLSRECVFDDPDFEDVDVFDFMWDPFGHSTRTCEWMVHRTWLSLKGCLDRIASGAWNTTSAKAMTEDDLRAIGSGQKYDEVWSERMEASGFSAAVRASRGEQVHEVWEWHDGERVLTVLDRQVLVQDAENPCVGQLPFQVYRPTPLQKQMVGIGDIEPIQHLNRELDMLRSQIRDSMTVALCAGFAYDDAAIEEEDLVYGPAAAIRVTNASPRDAIFPLPRPDIPAGAWEQNREIKTDIDMVTGYSEQPEAQPQTATESMLVQASLSRRIELQSRRFEIEVVRPAARCFLDMDQRMIVSAQGRPEIVQPEEGYDTEAAAREGKWRHVRLGPAEIQGDFAIIPEGGSMAAENVAQERQDGMQLWQAFSGNPHIDQRWLLKRVLRKFGEKDPDGALAAQQMPIPPAALDALARAGVNPQLIEFAVKQAQEQDPMLPSPNEQGPNPAQVDQMMGAPA